MTILEIVLSLVSILVLVSSSLTIYRTRRERDFYKRGWDYQTGLREDDAHQLSPPKRRTMWGDL